MVESEGNSAQLARLFSTWREQVCLGQLRFYHLDEVLPSLERPLYLKLFDQWGRGPSPRRGLVTPQLGLRRIHVSLPKMLQPLVGKGPLEREPQLPVVRELGKILEGVYNSSFPGGSAGTVDPSVCGRTSLMVLWLASL